MPLVKVLYWYGTSYISKRHGSVLFSSWMYCYWVYLNCLRTYISTVSSSCRDDTRCLANSEQPPSKSRIVNPDLQQKVLDSLFHIPDSPIRDPYSMNWKKVVQQVESFGQGLEYRNGSITEPLLNARTGTWFSFVDHNPLHLTLAY